MGILIPALGRSFGPALRGSSSLSDITPNFAWDFRAGFAPSGSTFTRASSGWYFNSAGVLVQAASNTPRYDYDRAALQPLGYLAETQSTNAILWSQDFSQTYWNKTFGGTGSAPVVAQNDATYLAPDGTQTAAKIIFNAGAGSTSGDFSMVNSSSLTVAVGSSYGGSVYARAAAGTKMIFRHAGGSIYALWTATGGWDRVSSIETAPGPGTTTTMDIGIRQGVNGTINSSATVWLWGAQFETAGVGVTSPIPTAGSAVTRAGDILSLPLTSLPGWNPSKGGVLVAAYRLHTISATVNQPTASIDDGSTSNMAISYASQAGANRRLGVIKSIGGGERDVIPSATPPAVFTRSKQALAWSVPRSVLAADGSILASDSGATALPTGQTTLRFGAGPSAGETLNGTVESLAYYAGARSDAFVQAVSR